MPTQADISRQRKVGKQIVFLKQDRDRTQGWRERGDVFRIDENSTSLGPLESGNQRQEGGFPCAAGSDDGGAAVSLDLRVDRELPGSLAKTQILEGQECHRPMPRSTTRNTTAHNTISARAVTAASSNR